MPYDAAQYTRDRNNQRFSTLDPAFELWRLEQAITTASGADYTRLWRRRRVLGRRIAGEDVRWKCRVHCGGGNANPKAMLQLHQAIRDIRRVVEI